LIITRGNIVGYFCVLILDQKLLIMKKLQLSILLFGLVPMFLFAQPPSNRTSTNLDFSGVNARIYSDGNMFQDIANGAPAFEVPRGNNSFSIYSSAFWMTALGQKRGYDNLSSAYDSYGYDNLITTGPIDIVNQTKSTDPRFQRLWKINASTIANHIQNWNTSGYVIPAEIAVWPGNGGANTAQQLAPFADLDTDGIYEPQNGEYPIIKGDQAVYLIANTQNFASNDSTPQGPDSLISSGLYIEMHVMLYAFATNSVDVNNTVFVNVKLYNRGNDSNDDHQDFKFSVYADFDLGNPADDYVGTDTARNMFYAYNGDGFDEAVGGRAGYGSNFPAQAVKFLDYDIEHSVYYNIGGGQNGDPSLPIHYANYQRGRWQDSSLMYYGGNGFNTCVNVTQPVSLMFPGNPNVASGQWTEKTPCGSNTTANPPGDRRMVGGPDLPSQFNHGTSIEFNYAYIFTQQTGTFSSPVAKLGLVADSIQNFFNNTIVGIEEAKKENTLAFRLFPNPAKSSLQIEISEKRFLVSVLNLNGSLLLQSRNETTLDLSDLPAGIYFVRIESENLLGTKKLVVVD
jgi:hypothetical protein